MNLDQIVVAIRNELVALSQSGSYTADACIFFHVHGERILGAVKDCNYDALEGIMQRGWNENVDWMDELLDRIFLSVDVFGIDDFNELLKNAMGVPK